MTDWKLKIEAFLYNLPWRTLCHTENIAQEEAQKLIRYLLTGHTGFSPQVKEADKIAYGLDVPPFVRSSSWDVFKKEPVLTHPMSGKPYNLRDKVHVPGALGLGKVKEAVKEVLKQIGEKCGLSAGSSPDCKKAFFMLWRLLPDKKHVPDNPLKPIWNLLPADPRVPDHTVWEHSAVTSAIASTYIDGKFKPAFLMFNIASAQDFISTARRTQDFWMGSFLLSYLTWEAIKVVVNEYGPDCLIFPSLHGQSLVDKWLRDEMGIEVNKKIESLSEQEKEERKQELMIANFPNVFTAIVPYDESANIGEKVINRIRDCKKEIFEAVKKHIEEAVLGDKDLYKEIEKLVDSQINDKKLADGLKNHLISKLKNSGSSWIGSDTDWKRIWKRQNNDFLESDLFWLIYPWGSEAHKDLLDRYEKLLKPDDDSAFKDFKALVDYVKENLHNEVNIGMVYQLLSRLAARFLSSRKNLRDFKQSGDESNPEGEPEQKCSLCGIREALHPEWMNKKDKSFHATELRLFWEILGKVESDIEKGKLVGRIRKGDRLCAVCVTKRLAWEAYFLGEVLGKKAVGEPENHFLFPSTSSIAAAKFKEGVIENLSDATLFKCLDTYVKDVKDKFLDNGGLKIFYPSASIPRLKKRSTRDELTDEQKKVAKEFLKIDGDWLFEESFDPNKIKREYGVDLDEKELEKKLEEPRKALKGLIDAVKELNTRLEKEKKEKIRLPSKYFAVINMDGDNIGKWIGGKKGPSLGDVVHPDAAKDKNMVSMGLLPKKRPLGITLHSALSKAQRDFALKIVRYVVEEKYAGKLIYAGGDDVMAVLPKDDLLRAIRELRIFFTGDEFSDPNDNSIKSGDGFVDFRDDIFMMMGSVPSNDPRAEEIKASASAGVAIVHHTHPFSHALEEVFTRAMKESAKEKLGRDAFAIHLIKRSGEPLEAGGKWSYGRDLLDDLQYVANLMRDDKLSSRLAYRMKDEALGIAGLHDAHEHEIRRLVGRHRAGDEKMQREEIEFLTGTLPRIPGEIMDFLNTESEKLYPSKQKDKEKLEQIEKLKEDVWDNFTKLLLIARFISEEA